MISALGVHAMPAVAQDSAAIEPIAPQSWIGDDDYPSKSLDAGAFGITVFRIDVDEAGAASDCHVLATSGYSALDDTTCAKMMRRARFRPARRDGKPAPSDL